MKYLILILAITFTSCKTEVKDYDADWLLSKDGEIMAVLSITKDFATLRKVYTVGCNDTTFGKMLTKDSIYFPNVIRNENVVRFTKKGSPSGSSIEMHFKTANSGILYVNHKDTFQSNFEKTTLLKRKTNSDYDKVRRTRYVLAYNIRQTQRDIDVLLKKAEISVEGRRVLTYLDSVKQLVLDRVNINYSTENCWATHDSILSYTSSTNFLIGDEPARPKTSRYSAVGIRTELEKYLNTVDNEIAVLVAFPSFENGQLTGFVTGGVVSQWEVDQFYHLPLGKVIETLNRLKVGVLQSELTKTNPI